ncbi:MAG: hypothetical protein ACXAAH_03350 [Promethearchaeota archaeon]|jgi:hypothetical protein
MSLQGSLASRKDCSGEGQPLPLKVVLEICNSTQQAAISSSLFVVLPNGDDYDAGIYMYKGKEFELITDKGSTNHIMELYPELIYKEQIELKELIRVGLSWQYLSLKVDSLGLGVSQRARTPKKINNLINAKTNQNHILLYSVAVRKRDRGELIEDTSRPLQKELEEGIFLLDIPDCYKDRAIYKNSYEGIPIDSAIFNQVEKKTQNNMSLHELTQLLWACQGETDHTTHGNRDDLEKNGYGRVHASGCAGYSVYPIVFVKDLSIIPKGGYWYNPVGFSALNRWVLTNNKLNYDHFLQKYTTNSPKAEIEQEFGVEYPNYIILLCIDRKKPCSGFMHSKLGKRFMDPKYWAEIEAGMALAGLQLQANALGLNWQKYVFENPDDDKYRGLFNLEFAEQSINQMATNLYNKAKNERLSLKSHLVPVLLFHLK